MELWDVYDRDRILTGDTMIRGEEFKEDAYHLVVHVCIFNSSGKMLIQKRQSFKEGWPDLWDVTVGGSAISGDTSKTAAEREVMEEIGFGLSLEKIRPALTINFEVGFDDIYLIEEDIELGDLKLQEEEVSEIKWATVDEIIEMIESGEFIPYHKSFIRLLFDMRKSRGEQNKGVY